MENNKQKTDACCDMSKSIKGIVCDVKNCAYHTVQNSCCAGTIAVGPKDATCSANTNCATFKPKEC
jgi:hypothetical protein